jgi:membrane associated rhomboid family serine protease
MAERDFITELKENFRRGDIVVQLIYINVGLFLLTTIVSVVLQLFNCSASQVVNLLALPASLGRFICQPWSILTYMFMHGGLLHILFNMLWLYWFGRLFLMTFSAFHLRGLYIFGGLCGGLLYMLAFNVFPYFNPLLPSSVLVGASASVLAIVAATAYRMPDYTIRFFMFGVVRLKYVAIAVVIIDLLFLTSSNGGGHVAHIGGALAGLGFAAGLDKGTDLTSWINKTINTVSGTKLRKPKMKVNYGGGKREKDYEFNARRKENAEHIDLILDKIKKSGYESLSNDEKKSLFDASKK